MLLLCVRKLMKSVLRMSMRTATVVVGSVTAAVVAGSAVVVGAATANTCTALLLL